MDESTQQLELLLEATLQQACQRQHQELAQSLCAAVGEAALLLAALPPLIHASQLQVSTQVIKKTEYRTVPFQVATWLIAAQPRGRGKRQGFRTSKHARHRHLIVMPCLLTSGCIESKLGRWLAQSNAHAAGLPCKGVHMQQLMKGHSRL